MVARMASAVSLASQLDRLAGLDGGSFPVVSLYLNLQADQHGRDRFLPFLRKELAERLRTFGPEGPERESLEKDAERIRTYVEEVDRSANGLALFACSGAGVFEVVTLAAPVEEHRLYISDQPHLYPLARVIDGYPRYAVLLADTNSAKIVVVALNAVQQTEEIHGTKTKRHKMGGWAQARYQRHVDNYHLHHAKEAVDALARIVRDESIESIVVAGDEVIVPMLKDELPKHLRDRVVDFMRLDARAPEQEILGASLEAMREKDAATDRERVTALLDAYRANGLATVGVLPTRRALDVGQVDEILIAREEGADVLIAKARQTGAAVRIIQDAALLAATEGVGAFLRYKL
jgi:peptide subunit release factor 1 (eRF1)